MVASQLLDFPIKKIKAISKVTGIGNHASRARNCGKFLDDGTLSIINYFGTNTGTWDFIEISCFSTAELGKP